MPTPVPSNPDVRPASWLERSGTKTLIVMVGGALVERLLNRLTGLDAPWAPYAAAAVRALWDVFRGPPSYRQSDPAAPDVVVRP